MVFVTITDITTSHQNESHFFLLVPSFSIMVTVSAARLADGSNHGFVKLIQIDSDVDYLYTDYLVRLTVLCHLLRCD